MTRELSATAQACAGWFRRLARALKVCRLYRKDNPVVQQAREQVIELLVRLVAESGGWTLRFAPAEILLADEPVVRQKAKTPRDEGAPSSGEDQLPFLFYRDGIRSMSIPVGAPREELEALFDALKAVGDRVTHDDLVTLLWQANLTTIQVESAPLEQTIYLSSRSVGPRGEGGGERERSTIVGAEIHADLGQAAGAQGLHKDTFDDWDLPDATAEVPAAYAALLPAMEYSRAHFRAAWEEENHQDWTRVAPDFLREILALDPREDTSAAVTHAVVTWIAHTLQRPDLEAAQGAIELLREFDPEHRRCSSDLDLVLREMDPLVIAEYLDEADAVEQARFAAIAVGLGMPAVDLCVNVMLHAQRSRTRAAACTSLCYLCAEQPELLEPYVTDARGDVVLQIVFVLGQIGGEEVVNMLRLAAQHSDARVRRQVVQALGGVPAHSRIPALLEELKSKNAQVVMATLSMLAREKNPSVAKALLEHISASEFESQTEDIQRAWFSTLGEVAEDDSVAVLETLLNRGGWLAKRSFTRTAVARTLRRIGSERAMAVLQAGLKSRAAAVRSACSEALSTKAHS